MQRAIGEYTLFHRISDGTYGSVWQGYRSDDRNSYVTIRCVPRSEEVVADRLRREIRVLKRVSHSNIVNLRGVMKTAENFYLVQEYCNGGNLSMYSRYYHDKAPMPEETALGLLAQLGSGLCALHDKAIVHARLCPDSILLSTFSDSLVLKIANFGNSCILKAEESTTSSQFERSPYDQYDAPEVLRQQVFGTSADMWSAGVIFHELLCGKPPFSGESVEKLLEDIDGFDKVKWIALDGADISSSVQQVMWALMRTTPSVRMTSCDLVEKLSGDGASQDLDIKNGERGKELHKRACKMEKPQWDSFQIPLAYLAHQLLKHNGLDLNKYLGYWKSMLSYSLQIFSRKQEQSPRTLTACIMGLFLVCVSAGCGLSGRNAKSLFLSPRIGGPLQLLSQLSIAGAAKFGKTIHP